MSVPRKPSDAVPPPAADPSPDAHGLRPGLSGLRDLMDRLLA
ncbi:MAG: hypothetical protein AAF721_32555 [Myxococcota bacterium]